jgi:lysophospholipase L1-like esterase
MNLKNLLLLFIICASNASFGQNKEKINITFFGSSVCLGSGAEDKKGYAYQFYYNNTIDTTKYNYFNASTGGDNTIKVEKFERLNKKLYPANPDFAVIGLSLSNEGLRRPVDDNGREQIMEQFRSRLLALADSLNGQGIRPVIVNCYAQSSFTKEHYDFTKRMNRILNTWKYPSINVLGAIDDWQGHWVEGHFKDGGHPNDKGHEEMSYTIVPSLFDAIQMGKKSPTYDYNPSYSIITNRKSVENPLSIEIDKTIHSFTLSFRLKKAENGSIAGFTSNDSKHTIKVENNKLSYNDLSISLQDTSKWTHVVLAHSYVNKQTMLVVDGKLVGRVNEQLSPNQIHFGGTSKMTELKDLSIHRSCLNTDEALDLFNKKFIQSSLEFYNPLTKTVMGNRLTNKAQSFSELTINKKVQVNLNLVKF